MVSYFSFIVLQIALVPAYTEAPVRPDGNPLQPGNIIYCNNFELDVNDLTEIPEICKKYMFIVGSAIQNQALSK